MGALIFKSNNILRKQTALKVHSHISSVDWCNLLRFLQLLIFFFFCREIGKIGFLSPCLWCLCFSCLLCTGCIGMRAYYTRYSCYLQKWCHRSGMLFSSSCLMVRLLFIVSFVLDDSEAGISVLGGLCLPYCLVLIWWILSNLSFALKSLSAASYYSHQCLLVLINSAKLITRWYPLFFFQMY